MVTKCSCATKRTDVDVMTVTSGIVKCIKGARPVNMKIVTFKEWRWKGELRIVTEANMR